MAQVFISYAREERETAKQLAAALTSRKWQVWWDRELIAGTSFDEVIERELELARAVVVLWSTSSVASDWVKAEATAAAERDALIPVRVEPSTIPLRFRNLHTVDLTNWTGDVDDPRFDEIERALIALVGAPGGVPEQPGDQPDKPATESPEVGPIHPPPPRLRVALAAAAVIVGVLVVGVVLWALGGSDDPSGGPQPTATIGGDDVTVSVTEVGPSDTHESESTVAPDGDAVNVMMAGDELFRGDFITSPDGSYRLFMQEDGNLTIHPAGDSSDVLWATGTQIHPGLKLRMQEDGNLVIYSEDQGVWDTHTFEVGSHMEFGDDAHLRVVRPDGGTEWSTEVVVPDVLGQSEGAARAALDELGLTPVVTSVIDSSPPGRVISTRPEAGRAVYRNSTVNVVVSREQNSPTTASTTPVSSTTTSTTSTTSTISATTTTEPT